MSSRIGEKLMGRSSDYAGNAKVGNYTNSEEALPNDTYVNTPFKGTEVREDGTAGIVTNEEEYTGAIRSFDKKLPVENGRYRLLWLPVCPWASRTKIALELLGIGEDVISTAFYDSEAEANTPKKGRLPELIDIETGEVVQDDYHRLPHFFETVWKDKGINKIPDLYPVKYRSQIDRLNRILFNDLENGAYAAGEAKTQEEYERNYYVFFNRLNYLERYLGKKRFLFGDTITDSDIRLFVVLARLDAAYYFSFRLNGLRLREYDNLWNYAKELYSIPAFRKVTDLEAIKKGYFQWDGFENPAKIVPVGLDEKIWDEPHNRTEKFGPLKTNYGQAEWEDK